MDANDYIYIPFLEKGRDVEGCDCWGLVRLVYKQELGIDLPSYVDAYETTKDRDSISDEIKREQESYMRPIDAGKERIFDVVLLRMLGLPMHVGIVTQKGFMLHTSREHGTSHVKYNSTYWNKRILGFYRYAG